MIKKFHEFNKTNEEITFKRLKTFIKTPQVLLDMLFGKIFNYISRINILYDKLAGKIDVDQGLNKSTIKDDIEKISIDDISNDKVRKSVKLRNLLNTWNVYSVVDREHEGKQIIYITKDELQKGDEFYGERLSEHRIDPKINNKRYLRDKGVKSSSELFDQIWIIVAKKTEEHDQLKREQQNRYKSKRANELSKKVNLAIKDAKWEMNYDWKPIFLTILKEDYVDLAKKFLEECYKFDVKYKENNLERVLKYMNNDSLDRRWASYPPSEWDNYHTFNDVTTIFDFIKSDEMKELVDEYFNKL